MIKLPKSNPCCNNIDFYRFLPLPQSIKCLKFLIPSDGTKIQFSEKILNFKKLLVKKSGIYSDLQKKTSLKIWALLHDVPN